MDTYIERNYMARILAAERTKVKREPSVLVLPSETISGQLRSLLSGLVSAAASLPDILVRALTVETKSYTYCTMNPSEC